MSDPRDDAQRLQVDPDADDALREGIGTTVGSNPGPVITALRALHPVTVWEEEWSDNDVPLPSWADKGLIEAGQLFFGEWDLDIAVALFCASLPWAYGDAPGVQVLAQMSQLAQPDQVARRVAETARWLLAVGHGGIDPGTEGYRKTREVRLLHAAIRNRLSLGWDVGKFGRPINQQDQFETLLSFTIVVFTALEKLGLEVKRPDQAAYLHLWAVIGHLLGVEAAERLREPEEATRLRDDFERSHAKSPAGLHLTAVLMREMELSMPWGLRKLPHAIVRRFLGAEEAGRLEIEKAPGWELALKGLAGLGGILGRTGAGRLLLRAPSRLVGRSLIRMWIDRTILGHHEPPFVLDPELLTRWRIKTDPRRKKLTKRGRARRIRYLIRWRLSPRPEFAGAGPGVS